MKWQSLASIDDFQVSGTSVSLLKCRKLPTELNELYPNWNFYFTNVARHDGNVTTEMYEASLGRETGTNNPLGNFMMATEQIPSSECWDRHGATLSME